ncbi:hypothetical protein Taro_025128 [Colocasia esculenta]|uniref:Trafficking protein particle complex subunit n=1 Tax=Colocasia esculenta TaxID=4460 RepID=A0A843VJK7_COLES|nr:hypothetical protein [Colocasia esculenta]
MVVGWGRGGGHRAFRRMGACRSWSAGRMMGKGTENSWGSGHMGSVGCHLQETGGGAGEAAAWGMVVPAARNIPGDGDILEKYATRIRMPGRQNMEALLKVIYELYTDYVLKNPFYELEMPIRCELFDINLSQAIQKDRVALMGR